MGFRLYDPEQMSIGRQRFRRMGPISLAIVIFSIPAIPILMFGHAQMFPSASATGRPFMIAMGLVLAGSVMSVCFGAVCLLLAHPIRTVYIALSIGLVCEAIATLFGGIPIPYLDFPGRLMVAAVCISSICLYFAVPKSWQPLTNICPKCEYDIEGLQADATQCPECGTVIARR